LKQLPKRMHGAWSGILLWCIDGCYQCVCLNFTDVNGVHMPIWQTARQQPARQQPGQRICLELTTRTWLAGVYPALAVVDQLQIICVSSVSWQS
jgi:hypothetical protein